LSKIDFTLLQSCTSSKLLCIGVYIASSGDALINDVNPSNFTIILNTLSRRENVKGW
jgi:hypothetical protein